MIPISKGSAGSEGGLLALLDLIANPKRVPDMQARLAELVQTRDEAVEALSKANELHAAIVKRGAELEMREAAVARDEQRLEGRERDLTKAQEKYKAVSTKFADESHATKSDLSARAIAVGSAEQSLSGREAALCGKELAVEVREKAADRLKAEYEAKMRQFKALVE